MDWTGIVCLEEPGGSLGAPGRGMSELQLGPLGGVGVGCCSYPGLQGNGAEAHAHETSFRPLALSPGGGRLPHKIKTKPKPFQGLPEPLPDSHMHFVLLFFSLLFFFFFQKHDDNNLGLCIIFFNHYLIIGSQG